jgi:hypothetical protein
MWKDTPIEILKMQNKMWLEKSPQERAEAVFGMFATARKILISNFPKNLSEQEFKKMLYERTYGEPLPEDCAETVRLKQKPNKINNKQFFITKLQKKGFSVMFPG